MTTANKRKNFGISGAFSFSVGTSIGLGFFVVLLEGDDFAQRDAPKS